MSSKWRWALVLGILWCGIALWVSASSADRRLILLVRNTAAVGLGACLVSLPLGTVLALLLARTAVPGQRLAMICLASLLFLPVYLHAAAWGPILSAAGWFSWSRGSLESPLVSGWLAVIWIHGLWNVPWVTCIVGAALWLSPRELEEGALLDGTSRQVFCQVTLPIAAGGLGVSAVWVVLTTAGEMTVTDLYQIRTFAEELYTGFALGDEGISSAVLWQAVGFTVLLIGLALATVPSVIERAGRSETRSSRAYALGGWHWPLAVALAGVLLLLVGVPLVSLAYEGGVVVEQVDGLFVRGWSWRRLAELLLPLPGNAPVAAVWEFQKPLSWTLLVGLAAASLTLGVAAPVGWIARRGGPGAGLAGVIAAAGLAIPGPLVGLGLLGAFSRGDAPLLTWLRDQTILLPVLASAWRALPLVVMICWTTLATVSRSLEDAAAIDGLGPVRRFVLVGLVPRAPAMMVAWLVGFALACGELSASVLVAPPGVTTVPIRVFGLLHAGANNQVAAICLTAIGGFLVVSATVFLVGGRYGVCHNRT